MSEVDLISTLRLIRSPGIGCVTFHNLIREYGNPKDALVFLQQKNKEIYCEKAAVEEIKHHERIKATFISYKDEVYPSLLKEIGDFPPLLSVLGNPNILKTSSVAIVGSRNASLHGVKFTRSIAEQLCDHGYTIISGLARGIDGAAHEGALNGLTIAVMAGGVDVLYPPEHRDLREKILEQGALISEMPLGLFPGASHFPRRNRIISGIAKGVCVMEASKPSGSLITASYALDQGRELFVVPGFPGDARCHGTNHLLKQGAYILQCAEDVIEVLGEATHCQKNVVQSKKKDLKEPLKNLSQKKSVSQNDSHHSMNMQKILESLSAHPLSVDEITTLFDIPSKDLHAILLNLELSGKIHRDMRGYIARVFE